MQNLTAHYNILFDARQILQQKQDDYSLAFIDSYTELLNVYQDTSTIRTAALDKDLQAAIDKANKLINYKDQSHYIGDAYFILGEANYLGGNYFDASEYFSYVTRTFPKQIYLVQEAFVWKARTQLYLGQPAQAKLALDTAFESINPKKSNPADVYATKLQYDINIQDYADAEAMAKQAVLYADNKKQRIRWTFILAQVQEINHENDAALVNYKNIAHSNANFEMAFNADLNRIRIEDVRNGIKLSRIDGLKILLKNPNNKEFKDQIYYQIAQIYLADKDYDNAIKYYKLSIRSSLKNQTQKGLSYLRIADIDFSNKADYVHAKKYYDSTLTTLSPNYPGYMLIQKKTNNLRLLTDRLTIIAREDTEQMLASLDEKTRNAKIDVMVKAEVLEQQAEANSLNAAATNASNTASGTVFNTPGGSSFYFYNTNAVSQGYNDFKKRWGNRKLEDNWRRSTRSNSDQANSLNSIHNLDPDAVNDVAANAKAALTAKDYRQQLVDNLPLTSDLLAQSNLRIFNAYFDIANFYRDILEDKKEAIKAYLLIETRFPDNANQAAIYYSFYRLYTGLDDARADLYKNKLLKDYAETPFAKVILDPDYGKKMDDQDAEFNSIYSKVYELYANRKYSDVVTRVDSVQKQYPHNKYSAQLMYLRAISAGHSETLAQFKNDLLQIATTYPHDMLIVPLVNQHLAYINTNLADMSARQYVLFKRDSTEVLFTPPVANQKQTEYRKPGNYSLFSQVADVRKSNKKDSTATNKSAVVHNPVPSGMFSMRDSTNYYFIIHISNNNTNLASSRFGIGQFDRANYASNGISHQLMDAGNDRLIFVGRFYSLGYVKAYARAIIPLLPEIMKIPKDKYTFFIITKENLDKLVDQKTLDSYIDYYQNNY